MATQIFVVFTQKFGEDEPILNDHIFSIGLVQPPSSLLPEKSMWTHGAFGWWFAWFPGQPLVPLCWQALWGRRSTCYVITTGLPNLTHLMYILLWCIIYSSLMLLQSFGFCFFFVCFWFLPCFIEAFRLNRRFFNAAGKLTVERCRDIQWICSKQIEKLT